MSVAEYFGRVFSKNDVYMKTNTIKLILLAIFKMFAVHVLEFDMN